MQRGLDSPPGLRRRDSALTAEILITSVFQEDPFGPSALGEEQATGAEFLNGIY